MYTLFRVRSLNYKLHANKVSYFFGPFHLGEQKTRSGRWAAPLTAISLMLRPFFRIVSGLWLTYVNSVDDAEVI